MKASVPGANIVARERGFCSSLLKQRDRVDIHRGVLVADELAVVAQLGHEALDRAGLVGVQLDLEAVVVGDASDGAGHRAADAHAELECSVGVVQVPGRALVRL